MKKNTTAVLKHLYETGMLKTDLFEIILSGSVDLNILRIMIRNGWTSDPNEVRENGPISDSGWDMLSGTSYYHKFAHITPAALAFYRGESNIYKLLNEFHAEFLAQTNEEFDKEMGWD